MGLLGTGPELDPWSSHAKCSKYPKQNNTKQNNQNKTQTNHKETQKDHKQMQNHYNKMQNNVQGGAKCHQRYTE